MTFFLNRILFLITALFPGMASACMALPDHLFFNNPQLVYNSTTIVLARAESASDIEHYSNNFAKITFSVNEVIKGDKIDTIRLTGIKRELNKTHQDSHTDFKGHSMPEFWAFAEHNASNFPDCNAYGEFEIGKEYLLILGEQTHFRAYEEIRTREDLWYKVIKLLVERQR